VCCALRAIKCDQPNVRGRCDNVSLGRHSKLSHLSTATKCADILNFKMNFALHTFTPKCNCFHILEGLLVRTILRALKASLDWIPSSVIPKVREVLEWDLNSAKLVKRGIETRLVAVCEKLPTGSMSVPKTESVPCVWDSGLHGERDSLTRGNIWERYGVEDTLFRLTGYKPRSLKTRHNGHIAIKGKSSSRNCGCTC